MAADKAIICSVQDGHVSNSQYFERINALVDTALSYRSSIGHSEALLNLELAKMGTDWDNATSAPNTKALELSQESYLSMLMLDRANYYKFKDLREEQGNNFLKGSEKYPTNCNVILHLLNSRKALTVTRQYNLQTQDSDIMFLQGDGDRQDSRKCFQCEKKGHIATHFPEEKSGAGNDHEECMLWIMMHRMVARVETASLEEKKMEIERMMHVTSSTSEKQKGSIITGYY